MRVLFLPVPNRPTPARSQAGHGVRVLEAVPGGRAGGAGLAGDRLRRAPREVRARGLRLRRARHPAAQAASLPQGTYLPFSRWLWLAATSSPSFSISQRCPLLPPPSPPRFAHAAAALAALFGACMEVRCCCSAAISGHHGDGAPDFYQSILIRFASEAHHFVARVPKRFGSQFPALSAQRRCRVLAAAVNGGHATLVVVVVVGSPQG